MRVYFVILFCSYSQLNFNRKSFISPKLEQIENLNFFSFHELKYGSKQIQIKKPSNTKCKHTNTHTNTHTHTHTDTHTATQIHTQTHAHAYTHTHIHTHTHTQTDRHTPSVFEMRKYNDCDPG